MKKFLTYALCLVFVFAPACTTPMSEAELKAAIEAIDAAEAARTISAEEAVALKTALEKQNAAAGESVWTQLLTGVTSVAVALGAVRATRGAPTQKVGLPESKVKKG